jgi:Flp pilus assembly protein TadG
VFRSADAKQQRRALWRDRQGIAALEFALALPILVMTIFGIVDFGRALAARNEMEHALGRAKRLIHLDSTVTPQQIETALEGFLSDFDTDMTVEITEVSGTSFLEVSVAFPFEISIPFAPVSEVELQVATLAPMVSPTQ